MVVAFCITVYFYDHGKYKVLKRQIEAIIFNHSFNKQAEYEKKVRVGKQKEKNYIFAPSLEKRQKGLMAQKRKAMNPESQKVGC